MRTLEANEQARFANQLQFFLTTIASCLETQGLRLVNLEGTAYDVGIAADALNLDDYQPGDSLVVEQVLEPTIVSNDGVAHVGKITVRRAT